MLLQPTWSGQNIMQILMATVPIGGAMQPL